MSTSGEQKNVFLNVWKTAWEDNSFSFVAPWVISFRCLLCQKKDVNKNHEVLPLKKYSVRMHVLQVNAA